MLRAVVLFPPKPSSSSFAAAPSLVGFSASTVFVVDLARVAPKTTRVCPSRPVAIGPGCATVTVKPRSATSPLREWKNAARAAFVAAYVAWPGAGHFAAIDPTTQNAPARRSSIAGRTALVRAIALRTLSSNMSRSTSSAVSSAAACCDPPATWKT